MKKKNKEHKIDLNEENEAVSDEQSQDINSTKEEQQKAAEPTKEPDITAEDKIEAELAESKDKYLRLYSEFDNYRRRTAKEKLELMQTAGERIVVALLPVLDDFIQARIVASYASLKSTSSILIVSLAVFK